MFLEQVPTDPAHKGPGVMGLSCQKGAALAEMLHFANPGKPPLPQKAPPTEILSAQGPGASKGRFRPFHHHGRSQG